MTATNRLEPCPPCEGDANALLRDTRAENAKLREDAIQAMWACDDDVCVHRCECDEVIEYPGQIDCLIKRRARDLGIEVDG